MWGPKCEKIVKAMGFAIEALEYEHASRLTSGQWPVTEGKCMSSSHTPTHLRAMACDQSKKINAFFT